MDHAAGFASNVARSRFRHLSEYLKRSLKSTGTRALEILSLADPQHFFDRCVAVQHPSTTILKERRHSLLAHCILLDRSGCFALDNHLTDRVVYRYHFVEAAPAPESDSPAFRTAGARHYRMLCQLIILDTDLSELDRFLLDRPFTPWTVDAYQALCD
jgi:hypothetical protein